MDAYIALYKHLYTHWCLIFVTKPTCFPNGVPTSQIKASQTLQNAMSVEAMPSDRYGLKRSAEESKEQANNLQMLLVVVLIIAHHCDAACVSLLVHFCGIPWCVTLNVLLP